MRYILSRSRVCPVLGSRRLSTFANQDKLPRLPIPDLEATAARYKRSLWPLLTPTEYEAASAKVDRFFKSPLATSLQKRLHELDEQESKLGLSWLDRLWLNKAYLEYRVPTLINVNWWYQFQDAPEGLANDAVHGQTSAFQLHRASRIIVSAVQYSEKINREEIPPEVSRSGPFCMHQSKNMFGASRIAAMPRDKITTQWPATAKHITVIYKNQIFSMPVFDIQGQVLSIETVQGQLRKITQMVNSTPSEQYQPPVGVMTSEHRDTWARIRSKLEKNPTNAQTFREIETSLFTLCLDDYSSPVDIDKSHRNIFHGDGANNRWFDKAIQFIVENNGRAGINGEHSPVDAVIPGRIFEDFLDRESKSTIENGKGTMPVGGGPKWLAWDITSDVSAAIETARENASKLISDLDSVLLHYNDYGSNFMKSAKMSPDGWMQMVYQLAYYRHCGKPCPTYESASTRKFLTGRTETVRSCSIESVAFTKAWDDRDIKMSEKLSLLQKAIDSHLEYMKAASNGMGVDRHLLGLRCQMKPEEADLEDAAMFKDPSYWGSQYWLLSTSNTSPGDVCWGGFGAVVPEGYGINYAIGKERVRMSVSSWVSAKETDSASFRKTIKRTLDDFGEVAERYFKA